MPSISVPCSQARLHHMIGGSSLITDHQLLPPALSAIPWLLSNDIYLAYILVKFRLLDLGQNQNDTLAGHRYYLLVATFFFWSVHLLFVGGWVRASPRVPNNFFPKPLSFPSCQKVLGGSKKGFSNSFQKPLLENKKNWLMGNFLGDAWIFFCGRLRVHPGRGHDFPEVNHDFTTEEK